MIIHTSITEQDLLDLEAQTFAQGKAHYESLGRTFNSDILVGQLGGVDYPQGVGTDYRQLVRWDEDLQAYWIKSASNFGLDPSMTEGLQALADSYDSVSTIDHELPSEEEV